MRKEMYVVQGFDMNKKIVDAKVCKSKEEAERIAEKMGRKGAVWINIEKTVLGAY